MSEALSDYFDALARLQANRPIRVEPGTAISRKSVALEAGRQEGSIRADREVFTDLILQIDDASKQADIAGKGKAKLQEKLDKATAEADDFRRKWEAAMAREVCLLRQVRELKEELVKLRGGTVVPIRGNIVS